MSTAVKAQRRKKGVVGRNRASRPKPMPASPPDTGILIIVDGRIFHPVGEIAGIIRRLAEVIEKEAGSCPSK